MNFFMIKERIHLLIKELNMSARAFCMSIGKSESWARTIRETIGVDVIGNILREYPQVNIYWLISGEGEMFVQNEINKVAENAAPYSLNNNYKELYEEVRKDNRDLREENKKLREELLEQMNKNQKLIIENSQLKAKSV